MKNNNSGKDTRNESYYAFRNEGKIQKCERQVLDVLLDGDLTDAQIASRLRWPISSVTGRRNALVEKGIVVDKGRVYNATTNRSVHIWGISPDLLPRRGADGQLELHMGF